MYQPRNCWEIESALRKLTTNENVIKAIGTLIDLFIFLIFCYIVLFSKVKAFTKMKVLIYVGQLLQTVDNSFISNKSKSRRINGKKEI